MIKLIDFGLATIYDPNCKPTQKCGTLVTVAPEVFRNPDYDQKVDCWALGVILFELLSNELPFFDKDAKKFKEQILNKKLVLESYPALRHVSKDGKDLITKLLQRDPRKRITAQEALNHPWFRELKM